MREIGDNPDLANHSGHAARRGRAPSPVVTVTDSKTLADRIEDLLPQTQCTKCGYTGCRPYAEAIAAGDANYNQCPPGGAEGVARLARLLGKPVIPISPEHGVERPRPVAFIDEQLCIGCSKCVEGCNRFGNGSLFLQVRHDRCVNCNECAISKVCAGDAFRRVPASRPYLLKTISH